MCETQLNSFIEINGYKIFFEKIGSGPNPILLIPGELGTARTDFDELLEGENELDFEKFTVVAVDPPGWGRSRPPIRKFGVNVYDNDCECFHGIMRELGFDKYSIIGFSEGTRVALLMAIKYPKAIISLVLSALNRSFSKNGLNTLFSNKIVDKWSKDKLNSYLKVYDSIEELQKLWTRYLKFAEFYDQYFPEDLFKSKYDCVKCPVLITHGDNDQLVDLDQPLSISQRLPNATLHRFPYGQHDCHRKFTSQYTKLVEDHILTLPRYTQRTVDILKDKLMNAS